jgi:hypothetical protein
MKRLLILALALFTAMAAGAQPYTVTLSNTVIGNNARPGLNFGQPTGSYPMYKNYLAFSNPGFEPIIIQQIFQFQGTCGGAGICDPTHFQWNVNNTQYVTYDLNQWAGANFTVIQGSYAQGLSDPALGCTGTVASSSANTGGFGPIFAINTSTNQGSSGCAGNLGVAGQVIVVSTNNSMSNVFPTPSSVWAAGGNGLLAAPTLTGSATMASETTDLCATCGSQSILFTVPSGGSATLSTGNLLNMPSEKTVTLNGTYTISFWAKSNAGTPPQVAITATPRYGSNCTQTYSGTSSPAITSTWTQFSFNCTFSETPANGGPYPFIIQWAITPVGGVSTSLEFDNWAFTDGSTNPTVLSDAAIAAFKAWCQSATNTTGPNCTLRYGPSPDSEVMSNWYLSQVSGAHRPSIEQHTALSTAYATNKLDLYDFFVICQYLGWTPVLIFPVTITTSDVQNMVDYMQGSSSTTYGNLRVNQGQTAPWVGSSSPFSTIYLEFGNENWNGGFLGHALGYNSSSTNIYEDYALRAGVVFTAARSWQTSQGYTQSQTKWVLNLQTASPSNASYALSTAHPDVAEINGYTAGTIRDVSTSPCTTNANCPFYGPSLTEPYSNTHATNSLSGFQQSVANVQAANQCGPSNTAACQVMVYEQNVGVGTTSTTQALIGGTGTYTSGITATGSTGQNCTLSFTTGGTGGVGYVVLTGTNTIASGAAINITTAGSGCTSEYVTTAAVSNGTTQGSSTGATCSGTATVSQLSNQMTQANTDIFVQAAFQGVVTADQMGENDAAGVVNQNTYQALQYYFGQGGVNVHMWGTALDFGGDCSVYNAATWGGSYCPRPQMLGAQVYNYCKIGPMITSSVGSGPTYNLAANNNSVAAINNVPLIRTYAFHQGSTTCIVVINSDVYSSYTINLAGYGVTSTATTNQFAPTALATVNEATDLNPTSTIGTGVSNTTTPGVSTTGYSLPPDSVTAFMMTSTSVPTSIRAVAQ